MLLDETVNKLIRDTINNILGIPNFSIRAKQYAAPKQTFPPGSFATVDFISDELVGWEQKVLTERSSDPDLDESLDGLRRLMISVNFFREGAYDNARKVRTGLARESIVSMFRQGNVGLIERSQVRHIPEALEDGWENRAQFDIFLSAVGSDTDIVRSIQTIEIAGESQTPSNIYNFNIDGDS